MTVDARLVGYVVKDGTGTVATTSTGVTNATGSTFIVAFNRANGPTLVEVRDSKANEYTQIGTTRTFPLTEWWICENGVGGSGHYAEVEFDAAGIHGTFQLIEVTESGGLNIQTGQNFATFPASLGTGTLSESGELVLAYCGAEQQESEDVTSTNLEIFARPTPAPGSFAYMGVMGKAIAPSTSSYTADFDGSDGGTILVATFTQGEAPPPPSGDNAPRSPYMTRSVKAGSADVSVILKADDSSVITHDTEGLALWYRREGGAVTSISPAALSSPSAAHTDGGVEPLGDGLFRLDLPDAAVAAGVPGVMVSGSADGVSITGVYVELATHDVSDLIDAMVGTNGDALTAIPWNWDTEMATALSGLPGDVWDHVIEEGFTAERIVRALAAIFAGKTSNGGTTFRNLTDTHNQVDATVEDGDRTAVTIAS